MIEILCLQIERCLNYKHRILLYGNIIEECQEILSEQGCNADENSIMEM